MGGVPLTQRVQVDFDLCLQTDKDETKRGVTVGPKQGSALVYFAECLQSVQGSFAEFLNEGVNGTEKRREPGYTLNTPRNQLQDTACFRLEQVVMKRWTRLVGGGDRCGSDVVLPQMLFRVQGLGGLGGLGCGSATRRITNSARNAASGARLCPLSHSLTLSLFRALLLARSRSRS
eukprot:3181181-Rhodomonas_salina.1